MHAATPEQRAKESAILYTCLADVGIEALLIVVSLLTLSLTLLSEALRGALTLTIDLYTLVVLRAVHRGRLRRFRFGIGKAEQICNLAIAAAMLFSGFWIAHRVVETVVFAAIGTATPFGLATAAAVNAINLAINGLGWLAMAAAATHGDSAIYRGQLRARAVKAASSAILQTTMTAAALAKDPVVSAWLDGLGATFVAVVMVAIGAKMIAEALPDLLDHPVPESTREEIEAALVSAGILREELVRIRTRCAGSAPQVELTLAGAGSLADYSRRAAGIEGRIRDRLGDADVSVVVDAREP